MRASSRAALRGDSSSTPQPVNGHDSGTATEESKAKRLNPIKRKQLQDRVQEIEEDIASVEAAIAHCETSLSTFVSAEETQRQNQELNSRRSELESLLGEWEELSQALEAAN
jgi:ATP-binding cassette subfamily F protein 3